MIVIRQFIAIILCICLVPLTVLITTGSVFIEKVDESTFWKTHLARTNIYSVWHHDDALRASFQESLARELPVFDNATKDLVSEATARAVGVSIGDPDWIEATSNHIIDELVPYLFGENDSLIIQPEFVTRISPALSSFKESAGTDEFFSNLTEVIVSKQGSTTLDLMIGDISFHVIITENEIKSILQGEETKQWYLLTMDTLVSDLKEYLTDETDAFEFAIRPHLELLIKIHTANITGIINLKIEQVFSLLPECSLQQIVTAALTNGTPEAVGYALLTASSPCVPPSITYEQAKAILGIDLEKEVSDRMLDLIPLDLSVREQADLHGVLAQIKHAVHTPPRIDATGIYIPELDSAEPTVSQWENFKTVNEIRQRYLPYLKALQFKWIHGCSLVFAIVIAMIAARGWAGRIKWAAIFLLLSGTILLALVGGLQVLAALTADQGMLPDGMSEYISIASAVSDLIRSVMRSVSGAIFPYGLGMCLGGLVLFGIGGILGKRKPRKLSSL